MNISSFRNQIPILVGIGVLTLITGLALFFSPQMTEAKGGVDNTPTAPPPPSVYSVRISSANQQGGVLTVGGRASINNFVGKEAEQYVKFIWGDGKTDTAVASSFLPNYYKSSQTISISPLTKTHVYADNGSHTVTVKIYHAGKNGAESYPAESGSDTITTENTEVLCLDTIDNDHDAWPDLRDSDCAPFRQAETTLELCSDHLDNDVNGKADLYDPNCASFIPPENTAETCADGIDNDLDGRVDLNDSDCSAFIPPENTPEACTDGIDNDLDGMKDGKDADCIGQVPPENEEGICLDAIDNDYDGKFDWDDEDCAPFVIQPMCTMGSVAFFIPGFGFICGFTAGY